MKILILLFALLSLSLLIDAKRKVLKVTPPKKDQLIGHNEYNLGFRVWKEKTQVETIAFVYTLQRGKFEAGTGTCCRYISTCTVWKGTENLVFDPSNNDGLSVSFISNAITASSQQYNTALGFNIFGALIQDDSLEGMNPEVPDGKNAIVFGDIDSDNIIAITYSHGTFTGPYEDRQIIEMDVVINDFFEFGDGSVDPSVMDLRNILTHELGHGAGLDHPPAVAQCADTTMYPTANYGETKKRTLASYDITCLNNLYSEQCESAQNSVSSTSITSYSPH